jgi:prepilin-type N-terminal cleavage/methylation domain-containing protein
MKNIFYKQNQKGFSLIEMMVVVVILGVIVLALVTFFTGGTKSWVAGQSQLKAQREARQAIDRMVREIREGNEIKSNSDSYSVTVYIPPFPIEGIDERYVFYALSGTTLQRDGNPLIDNVQINGESIFKYYNNDGTEVNPPDSTVSKVHINLKVDVDKDNNPDITLNTDVNLRNFGL